MQIKEQIKRLRQELETSLLAAGEDYDDIQSGLMSGKISTPELDKLYIQLRSGQAQETKNQAEAIPKSLNRYNTGKATNNDYTVLAAAGYGYIDDHDDNLHFVFTGKAQDDSYADWKEENMLGANL